MNDSNNKIVVAMSGGVDSSTVAYLLKESGWDVTAVTFRFFGHSTAPDKARASAEVLKIPLEVVDYAPLFQERVLRRCWDFYNSGFTPNPCVLCNPTMKWSALEEMAARLGAEKVATGHYARIIQRNGRAILARGADLTKDQSYFLFGLTQEQLMRTEWPLGQMKKADVRNVAASLGIPAAQQPESQDVCFASHDTRFAETLRRRFSGKENPGVFVDKSGVVLGQHRGVHQFTIGQRRGLGIALGAPAFVVDIIPEDNAVVLSTNEADLESSGLEAKDVLWAEGRPPMGPIRCGVQVRYRHHAVPAEVIPIGPATAQVRFDAPVKAVTPGQAVVCYLRDEVVAGGMILKPIK